MEELIGGRPAEEYESYMAKFTSLADWNARQHAVYKACGGYFPIH